MTTPFRVLSLGGGVQSSTLMLMAAAGLCGEIPVVAVHADTGWDPPSTLTMVHYLQQISEIPVVVCQSSKGALQTVVSNPVGPTGFVPIPAHHTRSDGTAGMGARQCTRQYKVQPIERAIRDLLGAKPRQRLPVDHVEQWIGFSTDEIARVAPNPTRWIRNRYPLLELDMSRADCVKWWEANAPSDAPVLTRSSCVGCPYHSAAEWVNIADEWPEQFAEACDIDEAMRRGEQRVGQDTSSFLHRRRIPLREAIEVDRRKVEWQTRQGVLFDDSDSDMCGGGCYT